MATDTKFNIVKKEFIQIMRDGFTDGREYHGFVAVKEEQINQIIEMLDDKIDKAVESYLKYIEREEPDILIHDAIGEWCRVYTLQRIVVCLGDKKKKFEVPY